MNSIYSKIFQCLEKTLEKDISDKDSSKHLHFHYGLDSIAYQKLVIHLEDAFRIEITEDIGKSGYFASVEGIATLLSDFYSINDT